jgi:hypothetical protein
MLTKGLTNVIGPCPAERNNDHEVEATATEVQYNIKTQVASNPSSLPASALAFVYLLY